MVGSIRIGYSEGSTTFVLRRRFHEKPEQSGQKGSKSGQSELWRRVLVSVRKQVNDTAKGDKYE